MDIHFKFDCSYKGLLTIDGREISIDMKPGETRLNWLMQENLDENLDETLGGIVAESLFGKFADIMQAWAIAGENGIESTWQFIEDEDVIGDISERTL